MLGSLPGAQSLAQARYYANPRNQFWRLIGYVLARELEGLAYGARLEALADAGVALWDAAHSAERAGSLDAAMRAVKVNDLGELAAALPLLRVVGFNGGAAWRLGAPVLEGRALELVKLPSSSPACTIVFAQKAAAWEQLRAAWS